MRTADELIPVVSFLSGSRRGDTLRLGGDRLTIGSGPDSDIRLPDDTEPLPLPHHATLLRRGRSFEIMAAPGAGVWVNGEQVGRLVLASGDVLEIGRDGSVMRFRLYSSDSEPYKTLPEIFADCAECARAERGALRKAGTLAKFVPRELATRTTRRFRIMTVAAIVLVATTTAMTARRNLVLERRLLAEIERVDGVSTLVEQAMAPVVTDADLGRILSGLQATTDRVDALEAMSTASARVIASAADAVVLLQGSYQFFEPESGRPLRMMIGSDGQPIRNPFGHPALSLDGDGPPLEVFLTGTGFVATPEGLVLTNRHVAIPWEFDDAASGIIRSGFEPRWRRFQAFLPGAPEAHPVDLVIASDEADLAVVQMLDVVGEVRHVDLATEVPAAGDAVLVMGYPLGLRALMARSDAGFISGLQRDGISDFFDQAERMAQAGFIQPLATRGIVGQVTGASVVYDAETTSGGSGGPVLNLDGSVVAVNTAILPEFGGSNLGVPAAAALALIRRARGD
jgi:S1-C subfamily serine protease